MSERRRSWTRSASTALAGFFAFGASAALADTPISVSASLSERSIGVGDIVTLTIEVTAHVNGGIEIEVPSVAGLTEVSRSKSEGTSISWGTAGQTITREYAVTIELEGEKPGKYTIPPIRARVSGHQASTEPLSLQILGDASQVDAETATPGEVEPPGAGEQKLFVRYKVDRASAYLGQQILLDLEVYAAPSLNFGIEENVSPPTLDGFWKEIIDQPQRLTRHQAVVSGRSYHVYRLWRVALFPLEVGERMIPSMQLTFTVNRSIFGGGQRERRKAPPIKLEIRPLPSEGRPQGFSNNNVGVYELGASVDHTKVPAGKAIVLTLTLSGRGNIKSARLPEVSAIPGFRVFDPTFSDSVQLEDGGITGQKKAEILLMPQAGGRLEIPAFELPIFNPAEERYARLATSSIRIAVEGDPLAAGATPAPSDLLAKAARDPEQPHSNAPAPKKALRPIRFRSSLVSRPAPPWKSPTLALLFLAPPLLYVLFVAGERIVLRAQRETPSSRRRAAAREAKQRLKKAAAAARDGDAARAYGEFKEALLDLASEKTGAALRGMTTEEAKHALLLRGAPEAWVARFVREMENADYARFAPGLRDGAVQALSSGEWERLLSELETWTPREAKEGHG